MHANYRRFIKSTPIHVMEAELHLQPLNIRRYYLAGKFWLKCRSVKGNLSIEILTELANLCHSSYWRRKKIPLLVLIQRFLQNIEIHSNRTMDIYSLDTWLSNIDLSKNIKHSIDGIYEPKKAIYASKLKENCQKFIDSHFIGDYQLYTDGSKNGKDAGAAIYDPQANITIKFNITSTVSIMYCELIAIAEALSYASSVDSNKIVILSDKKVPYYI